MQMEEEWARIEPDVLQRRLRGGELLVNYSEHHQDGNYQLVHSASLDTSLSPHQLQQRVYSAWVRTRLAFPVVGVELVSPEGLLEHATFRVLTTEREASAWAHATCNIVSDGQSVHEVLLSCLQGALPSTSSAGKKALLHLVIDPKIGLPGIVLHCSHVLSGHDAISIIHAISQELLLAPAAETFEPCENWEVARRRLPISAVHSYQHIFKPVSQDIEQGQALAARAAARYSKVREIKRCTEACKQHQIELMLGCPFLLSKNSIGVPVERDHRSRPSKAQVLWYEIEHEEVGPILQTLKRHRITLTNAFFACICSAIAQSFSQGSEEGAHLLFSAHAKRWLPTDGDKDKNHPVTMAIVPAGAWVDARQEELKARSLPDLIHLARKVGAASGEDVASPHLLGVLDSLATSMVEDLRNASTDSSTNEPSIGRPTLTSQGVVDTSPISAAGGDADDQMWLRIADWQYGGRNTEPSVCFAVHRCRRQIRYNVLYDEKFFRREKIELLALHVGHLFQLFRSSTPEGLKPNL